MLVNAPLINQLFDPAPDGTQDPDKYALCVAASLASALEALTGRNYWEGELKSAAYSPQYMGATNPVDYIPYIAQQGIKMWEVDGSGDYMVGVVHQQLAQGHPVNGAIPSMWGNTTADDIANNGGPTHAITFCDAGNGWLTAMNPWPVDGQNAFYQTMSDAWWSSRIVYGRVFPLERIAQMSFTRMPDGSAHDDTTGVVLHFGMAAYVLDNDTQNHALMGETYYDGNNSFVPFDGGLVLTYNKIENTVRSDRGGEALVALWNALQTAKANASADPKVQQLHGLVTRVISELQAGL